MGEEKNAWEEEEEGSSHSRMRALCSAESNWILRYREKSQYNEYITIIIITNILKRYLFD